MSLRATTEELLLDQLFSSIARITQRMTIDIDSERTKP